MGVNTSVSNNTLHLLVPGSRQVCYAAFLFLHNLVIQVRKAFFFSLPVHPSQQPPGWPRPNIFSLPLPQVSVPLLHDYPDIWLTPLLSQSIACLLSSVLGPGVLERFLAHLPVSHYLGLRVSRAKTHVQQSFYFVDISTVSLLSSLTESTEVLHIDISVSIS